MSDETLDDTTDEALAELLRWQQQERERETAAAIADGRRVWSTEQEMLEALPGMKPWRERLTAELLAMRDAFNAANPRAVLLVRHCFTQEQEIQFDVRVELRTVTAFPRAATGWRWQYPKQADLDTADKCKEITLLAAAWLLDQSAPEIEFAARLLQDAVEECNAAAALATETPIFAWEYCIPRMRANRKVEPYPTNLSVYVERYAAGQPREPGSDVAAAHTVDFMDWRTDTKETYKRHIWAAMVALAPAELRHIEAP